MADDLELRRCRRELGRADRARFGVIPVPFERTTSYGKGTADVVAASRYMELFDEQYGFQPADAGIWTLPCSN